MDRERLMEIIDSNGRFNLPTVELELLADHLIANGIGDVAHTSAEVRAKEALKHFESHCHDAISGVFDAYINGIAQGVDEKLNDYKNEAERLRVKLYETEQQLITEKHRADVAEEALDLAYEEWTCCDLCMFSFDCKTNRTDCKKAEISKIKQQAEARLKELEEKNVESRPSTSECSLCRQATALDKAGYRKQSETVKGFAEKLKELDGHIRECCMQSFCDMVDIIAEQYGKEE